MLLLDRPALNLTVREQANLLTLSRRSVYYLPTAPTTEEVTIKHAIDTMYTDQPSYGSRRIAVILERDHQLVVNRKAVQRHMREMGIAGISPGPNLSRRNPEHQVYPYLLRNLVAARPNHVWAIDITYIRLVAGWMYLVAVLDRYARYVVSWALMTRWSNPSSWMPSVVRWQWRPPRSGTATRGVTSPARSTRACLLLRVCRSAWMGRVGRSTTSLLSGSGGV